MSLSDDSLGKFEDVKNKKIQYVIMRIDELDADIPALEVETVGAFGESYDKFLSDLKKSKDCRFGIFSYRVNKKSHPVVFFWTPHDADSLTTLRYTKTNRELKKTDNPFNGYAEIHASDPEKLEAGDVTAKLEEFF